MKVGQTVYNYTYILWYKAANTALTYQMILVPINGWPIYRLGKAWTVDNWTFHTDLLTKISYESNLYQSCLWTDCICHGFLKMSRQNEQKSSKKLALTLYLIFWFDPFREITNLACSTNCLRHCISTIASIRIRKCYLMKPFRICLVWVCVFAYNICT